MRYKASDGVELYVEKEGAGTSCVFLHGGPGYWSKSFQYYAHNLLENSLEMIYLDQRGCGRSEHSVNYSLNRLITDLEELRQSLNLEEWYLMGHSFGGILAVAYARQFPERMKGLILSNVTLSMRHSFEHQLVKGEELLREEGNITFTEQPLMDAYYKMLSRLIEGDRYFTFQYMNLANKKKLDLIDQEGFSSDPQFQRHVFSAEEYFQDFTLVTREITKPVLILTGAYDDAVGPDHYKMFRFPNAEVRILETAHHPYIENKVQFQQAIEQFIQDQEK